MCIRDRGEADRILGDLKTKRIKRESKTLEAARSIAEGYEDEIKTALGFLDEAFPGASSLDVFNDYAPTVFEETSDEEFFSIGGSKPQNVETTTSYFAF